MRAQPTARRGFTLIEMVATIVVLAAMGSIASVIIISAVDSYSDAATRAQLVTEASLAMERMVTELRAVERDAGAATPNVNSVSPTSVAWNDDWSLTLTGDQIELVENGSAASVLLDDVGAFSVAAFDESNAALAANLAGAACNDIRRLALEITIARGGVTATVRSRVFLRATMEGAG